MQQITSNIYVETKTVGADAGFVTTTEGIVMIDTLQRPSDALKWRDEIAKRGEVRYLVNTEHHTDHFAGNYFFSGTVVSHQKTREIIAQAPLKRVIERMLEAAPDEQSLISKYQVRIPTVTFSERASLYVGRHTFDLIYLPGHTPGQTAVYVPEERVIFTGDNISHKVQVFLHESNPFQWLESLKKIEKMDIDIIVPGHGEVCDKSYIRELSSFIQEWIDTVKRAITQGLSKEEAAKKISFLDRYPMDIGIEAMGPTVQRWNVERLYDLLAK
jgi:cyclase